MKMRIGSKLMLGAGVGTVAVVLIVGFAAYRIARQGLEKGIFSHLEAVAQSRAAHVRTFLREHLKVIRLAATSRVLRIGLRRLEAADTDRASVTEDLNTRLQHFLDPDKDTCTILLLDRRGQIVASTNPEDIGLDGSTNAYFTGARDGPYMKDAYRSETTGRDSLAVSAPLFDRETGDLLGVLVARLDMTDLNKITTDRTGLGKTGETYLINKHGFMITPSRFMEDTFLKLKVDTEIARAFLADIAAVRAGKLEEEHEHAAATAAADYRGTRVLGVHAHVPEMELGLLAQIDADEAFAPVVRLRTALLAAGAAITVLVLAAAGFFARSITRPVHDLHVGSERIGRGELNYRLNIRTGDEIQQLAEEFNRMADKLKESHASLEQKVAERTAGLTKEITERKRVEEQLSLAAAYWQSTFDAMEDLVTIIDRDYRIVQANRAMRETFADREVCGARCHELFHGTPAPIAGCVAHEVFRTGEPAAVELQEPHLGNRWFSACAYPIRGKDGAVEKVVHAVRDITERKQTEEKLQRYAGNLESVNADLERSNRDFQDFTYTVSHDLQEPLRKIHTFAQFLVEDCGEQLPEDGRRHLSRIQNAAVRMKELIQHLLRLARVDTRGASLAPVEARKVLDEALEDLSEQIRRCGAAVSVEGDLPAVMADAVQLRQVFENLIGNALKFRRPDRALRIAISAAMENGRACFSVSDNGIGIESRFLEKVFGVFQRLHMREAYEGSGVGLALCRKVVQRHGGRIWVESEPGKGSTFCFTLRAATEPKEEKP